MNAEMKTLLDTIANDYAGRPTSYGSAELNDARSIEFREGLRVEEGRKYFKIIKRLGNQDCVWGFVVAVDNDKKFRKGDILMAAGYNAPARNSARGNILDGGYTVRWTGPLYL
jgi:hypothetical protein